MNFMQEQVCNSTILEFAVQYYQYGFIDHCLVPIDRNDSNQSIILQLFTGMTTASGTRPHEKNMILQYHQGNFNLQFSSVHTLSLFKDV